MRTGALWRRLRVRRAAVGVFGPVGLGLLLSLPPVAGATDADGVADDVTAAPAAALLPASPPASPPASLARPAAPLPPAPLPALPPVSSPTELRVAVTGKAVTLNPALTPMPATTMPGAQLFVSLFRLDAENQPLPYLAEQWTLAADGRSLRIRLVAGTRFHDGAPVTSRDVAFSIRATRDHHTMRDMLRAVERVETPDPLTVVIHLHEPHPALFQALATPLTPILPAHVFDDGQPLRTHPANLAPIGSGPFRFERWDARGRLILTRFEDCFLPGRPYLERIVFEFFEDTRQIDYAIAGGDVDLAPFVPTPHGLEMVRDNPDLAAPRDGFAGVGPMMIGLVFNVSRPPFDDRRVRQAIAWALDPEHLPAARYLGELLPVSGPFPLDHPFAHDAMQRYTTDLAEANRLLDAAGLVRDANGVRLRVELLSAFDSAVLNALAEGLRWHLGRKLGIEIDPRVTADSMEWLGRMGAGDFTIGLDLRLFWGDPLFGVHRTYHSRAIRSDSVYTNYARYAEPVVDLWLDAAGRETEPSRRRALYLRFQEQIAEDLPYLWLAQVPLHAIHRRDLTFPLDGPRAAVSPYDRVQWQTSGAPRSVRAGLPTSRLP